MELFIDEVSDNHLVVVDIAHPQYKFVFEGLKYDEGTDQIVVEEFSVLQSEKVNIETELEDLDAHGDLIIRELFFNPVSN